MHENKIDITDDHENVRKPTPHSLFGTVDFLHARGNSELKRLVKQGDHSHYRKKISAERRNPIPTKLYNSSDFRSVLGALASHG